MRYPTTLKKTAEELQMTQRQIKQFFQQAGHIRRDPMTDEWRVTRVGADAGTVIEKTKAYEHPVVGWKQYTQIRITAEGRRWLKAEGEQAA